jgi:hypothetical protein
MIINVREIIFHATAFKGDWTNFADDPLEDQTLLHLQILIHREPEGELPALELNSLIKKIFYQMLPKNMIINRRKLSLILYGLVNRT